MDNAKATELAEFLQQFKWKGLFGQAPRLHMFLPDNEWEIDLGEDYVPVSEAVQQLTEFVEFLKQLENDSGEKQ